MEHVELAWLQPRILNERSSMKVIGVRQEEQSLLRAITHSLTFSVCTPPKGDYSLFRTVKNMLPKGASIYAVFGSTTRQQTRAEWVGPLPLPFDLSPARP